MKLVCISDTHNRHHQLEVPTGDVLIHAGDLSEGGTRREIIDFLQWFAKQPHPHKICVAGNHDFYLEKLTAAERNKLIPETVNFLLENAVQIGGLTFWGSPYITQEGNWAFTKSISALEKSWRKIPSETAVIITHSPPYAILDQSSQQTSLGSDSLRKQIEQLKPTYHIFGHLHDNYGVVKRGDTTFINATSFNSHYALINPPIVVEI